MNETSKCHAMRLAKGHFEKYLNGKILDVGAGGDPLVVPNGTVDVFDKQNGDAQFLESIPDGSYQALYSSHCLEHLRDIPVALSNWRRVVRPGGFLYIVVPDYLLFEKLCFPSRHNSDHKHTFSLQFSREQVRRENHWTPKELFPLLGRVVEYGIDDEGFDYSRGCDEQTRGVAMSQIYIVAQN